MSSVRWSRRSAEQFDALLDHAASFDVRNAAKISAAILATVESLAKRPLGRRWDRPATFVRLVSGTRYLIIFGVEPGPGGTVRILRVYHSAQNWIVDPVDDA